jgi:hypothetical protein
LIVDSSTQVQMWCCAPFHRLETEMVALWSVHQGSRENYIFASSARGWSNI